VQQQQQLHIALVPTALVPPTPRPQLRVWM